MVLQTRECRCHDVPHLRIPADNNARAAGSGCRLEDDCMRAVTSCQTYSVQRAYSQPTASPQTAYRQPTDSRQRTYSEPTATLQRPYSGPTASLQPSVTFWPIRTRPRQGNSEGLDEIQSPIITSSAADHLTLFDAFLFPQSVREGSSGRTELSERGRFAARDPAESL